jgi:hypothetical protein
MTLPGDTGEKKPHESSFAWRGVMMVSMLKPAFSPGGGRRDAKVQQDARGSHFESPPLEQCACHTAIKFLALINNA